jgi:hypothetical protein
MKCSERSFVFVSTLFAVLLSSSTATLNARDADLASLTKSDMAQRILKQAANGVRDPVRLQASALVSTVDEPSSSIGSGPHHEASADQTMEEYIHQENLALFKKRLEAVHTDAEREVLLRLLADEEAKEPPPKIGKHQ